MNEAIQAKEDKNTEGFRGILDNAQLLLQKQQDFQQYKAAFLFVDGELKLNYFEDVEQDEYAELQSEILLEETCFVGLSTEATKLLATILITNGVLIYDEVWYENVRKQDEKTILVDIVDGPNETRESVKILSCN